jgi:hypothetical protein
MADARGVPDDQLLRVVAEAFAEGDPDPDPPPGSDALRWRDSDLGVADLLDDVEPVAVRTDGALGSPHRFAVGSVIVELSVDADAIVGSIEPWAGGGHVVLEEDGRTTPVAVDEQGRFRVSPPRGAIARLVVIGEDGSRIATSWFLVNPGRST